jgi:exodeoxyribonuclease-3
LSKNFVSDISSLDPDILCLQEIKVNPRQLLVLDFLPQLPFKSFHPAERLGYSGTAIFTRKTLDVVRFSLDYLSGCNVPHGTLPGQANNASPYGLSLESPDSLIVPGEDRCQIVDCEKFFLVNVCAPNAGAQLGRFVFRHGGWDPYFLSFLGALRAQEAVIVYGDFHVTHQEMHGGLTTFWLPRKCAHKFLCEILHGGLTTFWLPRKFFQR